MAFPTTGLLDAFTGADTTSPPSANWTNDIYGAGGGRALAIATNQAKGVATASDNSAWWNASTFGADSECYVTIAAKPATDDDINCFVRIQSPGSAATDGYRGRFITRSGTDEIKMYRIDNAVSTQLGSTVTQEFANGEKFGVEMIGTSLKFYHFTGGSWNLKVTVTDSAYASAGNIALSTDNTTARLDDFGGGTVVSATSVKDLIMSGMIPFPR